MKRFGVEYQGKYGQWFERLFEEAEAAADFCERMLSSGSPAEQFERRLLQGAFGQTNFNPHR